MVGVLGVADVAFGGASVAAALQTVSHRRVIGDEAGRPGARQCCGRGGRSAIDDGKLARGRAPPSIFPAMLAD